MIFPKAQGRLTGDRKGRTLFAITILLLCSILSTSAVWMSGTDRADAAIPGQAAQDKMSLQGVDLFAALNKHNDNGRLYALTSYDRGLYRNIFDAQSKGEWSRANTLLKRVHDPILTGHVLYDRYIRSDKYKSSYSELRNWMVKYGDHPDAYKVYQLAQKRRNNDPASLPAPQMAKKLLGTLELSWFEKEVTPQPKGNMPRNRINADVRQLMKNIHAKLANDEVTTAYNILGKSPASRMLTNVEYDALLGEIAASYYYNGKSGSALHLASQAVKRSGKSVPVAHWIAGLSAWRGRKFDQAAQHFAAINDSQSRNPWMLSAAAFWAARSYERMGDEDTQNDWLREAASYPRTFYGLVAQQALGEDSASFSWDTLPLSNSLLGVLQKLPSGERALALLDVGQMSLAEKELGQIHPNGNKRMEKALVAAANHFKLSKLAMRLGNAVNQSDGKLYDTALYPVVPWKGDAKTGIDPALVNALIRQESKFDPDAKNGRSGAKGLMQLMPRTAKFISRDGIDSSRLHDPETNITLGQRYVRYLLNMNHVDNNLIYMAAAYNAGPGNLYRWQKSIDYNDDPFLFIESIPMSETRAFVERVMTNYWIYAQRLDQETETLEALAAAQWPTYDAQAGDIKLVSY
jgi:soluble lytic murein transglycosylase